MGGCCVPTYAERIPGLDKDMKTTGKYQWFRDEICDGNQPTQPIHYCPQLKDSTLESSPIQANKGEEELVFMDIQDNRTRVNKPQEYPYSSIGLIAGKVDGTFFHGSGALISDKMVLTCAHNCYNREKKMEMDVTSMEFSPAANQKIGKGIKVSKFFYPEQYKNQDVQNYQDYDFALLQLQRSASTEYGYIGIDTRSSNVQKAESSIEVIGYPGDKNHKNQKTMWSGNGICCDIDETFIYYKIPTSRGQSGGPVMKKVGNKFYVVGVHTRGDPLNKRNCAIRLNTEKRKLINDWIKQRFAAVSLELSDKGLGKNIKSLNKQNFKLRIVNLNLNNNNIQGQYLQYLSPKQWQNLRMLKLSNNPIGNEGLKYLKMFSSIDSLELWNCQLTHKGIQNLPTFQYLTYLCLSFNSIGNQGLLLLTKFRNLKILYLSRCEIDGDGLLQLTQNSFPHVQVLTLKSNMIGDQGIKYLKHFRSLRNLWIEKINMSRKGLNNLVNLSISEQLKKINVSHNQIGDDLKGLAKCKQLEQINLYNTNIKSEGARTLIQIVKQRKKPLTVYLSGEDIKKSTQVELSETKQCQQKQLICEYQDYWSK